MLIPQNNIGTFAAEVHAKCSASRKTRLQRGAAFRSLFLEGSGDGVPAIFPYTFAFIDNLASFLYSPVELRFIIDKYGSSNPLERAKFKAAGAEFHKHFVRSDIDSKVEEAVLWALVKGKTFVQLSWTAQGLEGHLIQPEMMGVWEENITSLNDQEAFSHTTYISPDKFWNMIRNHPNRDQLFQKASKYAMQSKDAGGSGTDSTLRQIVVGGLQPLAYQGQSSTNARGNILWLQAPAPELAPEIASSLIPLHQLWIKDDQRRWGENNENREYTTIQFIGEDVVISGDLTHRNLFADQFDLANKEVKLKPTGENPLTGMHPYIEICPNSLDGYFWGRSELCNVARLQRAINDRIEGIDMMLRRQEDPPKFFSGVQGIKQAAYSLIKKAGGYFADPNPAAKVQDMYPQLPEKIFESLHEYKEMFNEMAGFTPTLSGRGDAGVRSSAQADALVRTGSPRFKDRALVVEKQINQLGSVMLDMLKAHCPYPINAYVTKEAAGEVNQIPPVNTLEQSPVPNLIPVPFTFYDIGDECKVTVDSHSSSPAFSAENRALLFDLYKAGIIDAEILLQHLGVPSLDSMLEAVQLKKFAQAQFAAQHPELAEKAAEKSHKKK